MKGIILVLTLFFSLSSFSKELVNVGLSSFPPYIEYDSEHRIIGLAVDFIKLMNASQDKYIFQIIPSSPMRRFDDFNNGKYDISLFDHLDWGWKNKKVKASDVYLEGSEVYVALAKHGRDEEYFSDFSKKIMVGIRGYHYGFAGFNNDPDYLQKKFNMMITDSHKRCLQIILDKQGDIAVVTEAYLNQIFKKNPNLRKKLIISKRLDQPYRFSIIVRDGIRPSIEEINQLLVQMKESKKLDALWKKYHIFSH